MIRPLALNALSNPKNKEIFRTKNEINLGEYKSATVVRISPTKIAVDAKDH